MRGGDLPRCAATAPPRRARAGRSRSAGAAPARTGTSCERPSASPPSSGAQRTQPWTPQSPRGPRVAPSSSVRRDASRPGGVTGPFGPLTGGPAVALGSAGRAPGPWVHRGRHARMRRSVRHVVGGGRGRRDDGHGTGVLATVPARLRRSTAATTPGRDDRPGARRRPRPMAARRGPGRSPSSPATRSRSARWPVGRRTPCGPPGTPDRGPRCAGCTSASRDYLIPVVAQAYLGSTLDPALFDLGSVGGRSGRPRGGAHRAHRGTAGAPGRHRHRRLAGVASGYVTQASARAFGDALARQWVADRKAGHALSSGLFAGIQRIRTATPTPAAGGTDVPHAHPGHHGAWTPPASRCRARWAC